jgi:hypothetical protein
MFISHPRLDEWTRRWQSDEQHIIFQTAGIQRNAGKLDK